MASAYPRQREVYLIKALRSLGDTKKRPAIVVSIDVRNQFKESVLIVPLTSDLSGGKTPTRILVPAGEGGLETDSLALCENISGIRKLNLERAPYGEITANSLEKIQRAIQIAIGVF